MYQLLTKKVSEDLIYESFLWTGLPMGLGETLFTLSLSIGNNVGLVSIVGYSTVVIAYILSILRYGERINAICMIGAIFVIGGVVKITFEKSKSVHDPNQINLSKTDVLLKELEEDK